MLVDLPGLVLLDVLMELGKGQRRLHQRAGRYTALYSVLYGLELSRLETGDWRGEYIVRACFHAPLVSPHADANGTPNLTLIGCYREERSGGVKAIGDVRAERSALMATHMAVSSPEWPEHGEASAGGGGGALDGQQAHLQKAEAGSEKVAAQHTELWSVTAGKHSPVTESA